MSVTRNLMSSALFALPYLGYQPVEVSNGEPAIRAGNLTKQTILGPPFAWPWNRNTVTFDVPATDANGNPFTPSQDYAVQITDFGFLEKTWLTDGNGNEKEIKIVMVLAAESSVQRPASVAVQEQDTDGYLTFRLNAIPDQSYTFNGVYQKAPVEMTSTAATWSPIPDHMGYIYDYGFLYFVSMLTKDARAGFYATKFVSHLLGAQSGLNATQRNIFLGNFLDILTEPQRAQAETTQGVGARQT